jgi:uncharacterized protein
LRDFFKLLPMNKVLIPFVMPVGGLKLGLHTYSFQLEKTFFDCFENSPIEDGRVTANMKLNKHQDFVVLNFEVKGTFKTTCDRCLTAIELPLENEGQLIVKYSDEEGVEDDADIAFVPVGTTQLSVAQYIYEFVCLGLPYINAPDNCEATKYRQCDKEMLKYLKLHSNQGEAASDNDSQTPWNSLKDWQN